MQHASQTVLFALSCAFLVSGCERAKAPAKSTGNEASKTDSDSVSDSSAPSTSLPDAKCEQARPRFEDLAWMVESRLSLLVERHDQDLKLTLSKLAAGELEGTPPLPVFARFELQNLSLEMRALSLVLEGLGLEPAQLLKLHGPKNESVWFLPTPCDYAAIEARARARWGVMFRGEISARIGIAPSASALPFDLLLLPGGRAALVPRGRSGAVLRWLNTGGSSPGASALMGASANPDASPPGTDLLSIQSAPLRLRLTGRALGAQAPGEDARMTERLRIRPDDLQRVVSGDSVAP